MKSSTRNPVFFPDVAQALVPAAPGLIPALLVVTLLFIPQFIHAGEPLTGFPFQNETLRYNINWPSGLSLGEAVMTAHKAEAGGWNFEASFNVGVPGFPLADKFKSSMTSDYCSVELDRDFSHGSRKSTETTKFDQKSGRALRQTMFPLGGGKTDLDIPSCAKDALAFQYFARKELGQGRVPPAGKVFFGGAYQLTMTYTGAMNITIADKQSVTDHVNVNVKGPSSSFTFEVFYARDAARTPLMVKIPVAMGTISLELAR
jgi:hypothetical protein